MYSTDAHLIKHVTKSHVTDSTLSVDSVTDGTQEEMEAAIRKRAEQTIPISNTFIHEILVGTGGLPIRVCIEIYTYYCFFFVATVIYSCRLQDSMFKL